MISRHLPKLARAARPLSTRAATNAARPAARIAAACEAEAPRALRAFSTLPRPAPLAAQHGASLIAIRVPQRDASTAAEGGNKKFLGKVSHEFGAAFDGLAAELGVTAAERQRIMTAERTTSAPFSFTRDDGSIEQLTGFRTVFSTLLGPGKGGLRVVPNLDGDMVKALAFEMCPKAAITGVPVGGGKGGFAIDASKLSKPEFARAMRAFVVSQLDAGKAEGRIAFGPHADVPAPDVGTSPPGIALMDICADAYLGWLADNGIDDVAGHAVPASLTDVVADHDGTGTPFVKAYMAAHDAGAIPNRALLATFTGKSVDNGGSLGRTEATGLGVALATREALRARGLGTLGGKRVAVQGYGNVGQGAVQAFTRLGAKVTAIAEFDGAAYAVQKPGGFTAEELPAIDAYKAEHKTLRGFPGTETIDMASFWGLEVDVLTPCARENELNEDVARLVRAPIVVEGANGPTTTEGDKVLAAQGTTLVPDVLANAGGVTVSQFEMQQNLAGERWSQETVREKLDGAVSSGFGRVHAEQQARGGTWREAAYRVAVNDLVAALRAKG